MTARETIEMTGTAQHAINAYQTHRRTRRTSVVGDRIADGMLAVGSILIANSILPLQFDLPAGKLGMSAGGMLVATAFAWMRRHGARRAAPHAVAQAVPFKLHAVPQPRRAA